MPDAIDTRASYTRRPDEDDPSLLVCASPLLATAAAQDADEALACTSAPPADYALAAQNPALRSRPSERPYLPPGIELAMLATVPHTDRDDPSRSVAAPPYVLHAQMARADDGTPTLAYYLAYNKEAGRVDYVVKPDAVEDFRQNVVAFTMQANLTMMNGGPTRDYQKESLRAVDAVMHGQFVEAVGHLVQAHAAALTDPIWYAEVAMASMTEAAGALSQRARPVLSVVAQGEGGVARAAAPRALRSVATREGIEAAGAVSLAARREATQGAARPTLSLVEGNAARVPVQAPSVAPLPRGAPSPLRLASSNAEPWKPLTGTPLLRPVVLAARNAALAKGATLAPRVEGKKSERTSDDEALACAPRPLGKHRGSDTIHNACADAMGNVFPGSDVMVGGKAFDGLTAYGELLEVKTGYPSQYGDELPQWVFNRWVAEAERDGKIAGACGFPYVFAVADPDAIQALTDALRYVDNVEVRPADKDECVR